jgi:hypothetical protein
MQCSEQQDILDLAKSTPYPDPISSITVSETRASFLFDIFMKNRVEEPQHASSVA